MIKNAKEARETQANVIEKITLQNKEFGEKIIYDEILPKINEIVNSTYGVKLHHAEYKSYQKSEVNKEIKKILEEKDFRVFFNHETNWFIISW